VSRLAALVAGALLLGGCSAGDGPPPLLVGASSNYQFSANLPRVETDLAPLAGQGLRHIREDITWKTVQPAEGRWVWTTYDRLFAATARIGVDILPVLDYGTDWATGGERARPADERSRAAYAAFARTVVDRYGPQGTFWAEHRDLPAHPVDAVEVWNEPWYPAPGDPAAYAALVRATAGALRGRHVRIVACADDRGDWLAGLLAQRSALDGHVDAWSVHPYARDDRPKGTSPAQDAVAQLARVRDGLARAGLGGEVWVTELGFRGRPTKRDPGNSPAGAAAAFDEVLRFLRPLASPGPLPRVARVYAFTLARPGPGSDSPTAWDYGYNLIGADGTPTPALRAVLARDRPIGRP
jgi:hypothetical protein